MRQDGRRCHACNLQLSSEACYGCQKCYFFLHKSCFEIPREIQHRYHPHSLNASTSGSDCKCDHCDQLCESAFYKCFECDFNVHLRCIPIPPKVDYQWHPHPLTLKDSLCEDDSDVYCCYACGESRNPHFLVYWCEECPEEVPYVAHVECIVPEEDEFCRSSWNTSPRAVDKRLQGEHVKEEEGEKEEREKEENSEE